MPEKRKRRNTPNSFSGKTTTWKLKPTSCFILLELTSWSAETYSRTFQGDTSWVEYGMPGTKETFNITLNEQIKLIMDPEYQWHRQDKGVFSLALEHPT